jgi:hypothetical protein
MTRPSGGKALAGATEGSVGSTGSGGRGITAATEGKLGSAGSGGGGSAAATGGVCEIEVSCGWQGHLRQRSLRFKPLLWLSANARDDLTGADSRTLSAILHTFLSLMPHLHVLGRDLGSAFGAGAGMGIMAVLAIRSAQETVIQLKARAANTPNLCIY